MVYTIGESVLDIIIKDFDDVKIRPGGSMLNTAISLGRLGVNVSHISVLSNDINAFKLIEFLSKNSVDTSFILKKAKKTNLALAYLDEQSNASYTFYKETMEKKLSFKFPEIQQGDFVLFGSFFCLNPSYRDSLVEFLKMAKNNGAIIIYDPNFRKIHLAELSRVKNYIIENLQLADIVKASDEDLMNLFEIDNGAKGYDFLQNFNVNVLLYTQGSKVSQAFVNTEIYEACANKVKVVSTIGAGDTFSAGVLYSLTNQYKTKSKEFEYYNWNDILELSNLFAGTVCSSYDNYLSIDFIQSIKNV